MNIIKHRKLNCKDKCVTAKTSKRDFGATTNLIVTQSTGINTDDDYDCNSCLDKIIYALKSTNGFDNLRYEVRLLLMDLSKLKCMKVLNWLMILSLGS
jgi:hypothetical protein